MNRFHQYLQYLLFIIVATDSMCQQLAPFVEILRKSRTSRHTNWKMDEILPPDYNNLVAPNVNNTPVDIDVTVAVLSLRSVREKSMSFAVEIFFHQYWDDQRLRLPVGVAPTSKIRLNEGWRDRLWTPDTYFRNAIEGSVSHVIDPILYFKIENQTKVFMAVKVVLEFSCETNFFRYPFDTQKCSFELSSLSNTMEALTYTWRKFHINKHIHLHQFQISNVSIQRCVKIYEDVGTFSCLRASLTIKRNVAHYVLKRYVPTALAVVLAFVTFWLPISAYPARVGLILAALLSLSSQNHDDINVSYVYALSVWLFLCNIFVFATLIEFSFAYCLQTRDQNHSESDSEDKRKERTNAQTADSSQVNVWTSLMNLIAKSNSRNNCVDVYSRIAFPVSFFIVIIVYSIVYIY